jgi:hypothetical protein
MSLTKLIYRKKGHIINEIELNDVKELKDMINIIDIKAQCTY